MDRNAVDFDRRVLLAMSLLAAIPFTTFVFENENFFGLSLFNDRTLYRDVIKTRGADLHIFAVGHHQYIVKRNFAANVAGEFFDSEGFAFLDFILFSA